MNVRGDRSHLRLNLLMVERDAYTFALACNSRPFSETFSSRASVIARALRNYVAAGKGRWCTIYGRGELICRVRGLGTPPASRSLLRVGGVVRRVGTERTWHRTSTQEQYLSLSTPSIVLPAPALSQMSMAQTPPHPVRSTPRSPSNTSPPTPYRIPHSPTILLTPLTILSHVQQPFVRLAQDRGRRLRGEARRRECARLLVISPRLS